MPKTRKTQNVASTREIEALRRLVRESIEEEIILGEDWKQWFGLGKKSAPAEKEPSAQEKYAAGEGKFWNALNKITPQMSLGDILNTWKSVIKNNLEFAQEKGKLSSDTKSKLENLVSNMKKIESLDDLLKSPAEEVPSLRKKLEAAADGAANISKSIDDYKKSASASSEIPKKAASKPGSPRGVDLMSRAAKAGSDEELTSGTATEARLRRIYKVLR